MAATTNKQTLLTQVHTTLKKKLTLPSASTAERTVLEEVLYGILRDSSTPEAADAAWAALKTGFHDLNEIRVSSVTEVAEAVRAVPQSGDKGERVVDFLQKVFEEYYSFDLSEIAKKGVKQAAKQLARFKGGVNDFVVAWVTQRALGGHALPLDEPSIRALKRLGILAEDDLDDLEAARATLEHFVPKAKGPEFTDLLSLLAATTCTADLPNCSACPLKADCPAAADFSAKAKAKPAKGK